jgi:adenylate cyclase
MSLQLAAKYLNRQIEIQHTDVVTGISLVGADGKKIEIPLTRGDAKLLLNHYGEFADSNGKETPVKLSLADAAENKIPKDVPEILILGSTTLGIDDRRPSPVNPTANGVEHHVAAIENIIQRDFLVHPDKFIVIELFFLLVTGLLLCFLLSQSSALTSVLFLVSLHVGMELIDQKYIFGRGRIINLGLFHFQNVIIFTAMILFKFLVEEKEKRKIKGAFQHYLNPTVINQLLESPDSLKLGGEKRELTVFFSDVRGFTTISERLAPEALANLLNEYFTPMTNIVLNSGGLLDKYIGDALMAVWGAPLPMDNHADNALHASLKMLDALDVLREGWQKKNLPAIDIGCGINTGPMVIGNMGSDLRFDYTVLGDAVNLGARLEGITKEYGVRVVCSEMTRAALKGPQDFVLRELDWIKVKGKNEPVTIFEVMRFKNEQRDSAETTAELFKQGLSLYRQRDFIAAQHAMMTILQKNPHDGPAGIFLERCEYFIDNPPSENWDGVWVMKSK